MSPAPIQAALSGSAPSARRWMAVLAGVAALKAFALGATGSVSALVSLAETLLVLAAFAGGAAAARWRPAEGGPDKAAAKRALDLMMAGAGAATALILGAYSLTRVAMPFSIGGNAWALGAMAICAGLALWFSRRPRPEGDGGMDAAPQVAALIGLIAGGWLGAPQLDAVGGLMIAAWIGWGAFGALSATRA